ncbi:MAG: hypothetical protein ABIY70_19980 [Capsulimonas sp.]|uniref:hypothetical protein n=1 Tax=Capsulimonas sp. TaxID=2494211 RepID=UPI003265E297
MKTLRKFQPLALAMLVLGFAFQISILTSVPAYADEQCVAVTMDETTNPETPAAAQAQGLSAMAASSWCTWACSAACAVAVGAGCATISITTGGTAAVPLVLSGAAIASVAACCVACDAYFC